jgi:hypothetical protein
LIISLIPDLEFEYILNYKFYTLEKSELDLELTFFMGLKLKSNFKSKTQLGIGTWVQNFYCKFQCFRQLSVIFKQTYVYVYVS